MTRDALYDSLERMPIISAVHDRFFPKALTAPTEVIFLLGCSLLTIPQRIRAAHEAGKIIFVHMDLAEGLGKDRAGVQYLAQSGADGVISTRGSLIRCAKEAGLLTVQRFFALDSQGIDGIAEMVDTSCPDLIEIMPGIMGKIIRRFAAGTTPVIAGGLVETKAEVTEALSCGASAVSTGKETLWYM